MMLSSSLLLFLLAQSLKFVIFALAVVKLSEALLRRLRLLRRASARRSKVMLNKVLDAEDKMKNNAAARLTLYRV